MRLMRRCLFLLPILILWSCGKAEDTATGNYLMGAGATPHSPNQPLLPSGPHAAALWNGVRQSSAWTNAVVSVVRARMGQFDLARDVEEFCPGYGSASLNQREACWVRLISAVSKFESGFNPRDTYREDNGRMSIGLLALSSGECPEAKGSAGLKNPIGNLLCGTRIMAELIARDGSIESPAPRRGASAYWSVLRRPYSHNGNRHGRRHQIIQFTQQYRAYAPI